MVKTKRYDEKFKVNVDSTLDSDPQKTYGFRLGHQRKVTVEI